ncbi:MAG: Maf family protein [Candidatus Omnitrophota bacterium]
MIERFKSPAATPKVILASNSPQRKLLLKRSGLSFIIRPSRVKESTKIRTSCSAFVKHNALLKAQDVAERSLEGIVIGADTIVYLGHGRIIGKPKDFHDAKRILKTLFARPHWVYTGVAVVDVRSKRRVVDYEKTKVYMNRLSDAEIERYHQKMSPLDKAGGFDIEGWGGLFIRRIEGCYSNVIGLPMAKLTLMLKEFGIEII